MISATRWKQVNIVMTLVD